MIADVARDQKYFVSEDIDTKRAAAKRTPVTAIDLYPGLLGDLIEMMERGMRRPVKLPGRSAGRNVVREFLKRIFVHLSLQPFRI